MLTFRLDDEAVIKPTYRVYARNGWRGNVYKKVGEWRFFPHPGEDVMVEDMRVIVAFVNELEKEPK